MQIFNVRLGLATNSSSSHSLIFLNDFDAKDFKIEDNDFGWDHFTVASENKKLDYLGVLLRDRLVKANLPDAVIRAVMRDWLRRDNVEMEGYIDHQSWMYLPSTFGTNIPDGQFVQEFVEYLKHPKLAILGGNDNTELSHPLTSRGTTFKMPLEYDNGRCNWTCRKDEQYNYWTIFQPDTGTKVRFSLEAGKPPVESMPKKAFAPELVDIKITDFCPFGCTYCYQASTTAGRHCNHVYDLANALGKLKVFEVALGGGEPTMHPEFVLILRYFRDNGVVPNFTTKNIHWLHDPIEREDILKYAGAFAVSVENRKQIEKLATTLNYTGVDKKRCNLHIVMGTVSPWEFGSMLSVANDHELRTTLLGYKNVGFGQNFQPQDYKNWLKEVKLLNASHRLGDLSIDTVLAAEFEKELQEEGISNLLYHTEDGKFSCYIDWVAKKIGPSSYCDPSEMKDLNVRQPLDDQIKAVFAEF